MKNENTRVPQIRFKGFDTEWTSKKYTEVFDTSVSNNTLSRAELTTEKTSTKNVHYGDVLIKYNSILDIKNDDFPFIPDEIKIDSKDLLKNGDIIFADTAEDETCGKATEIYNLENEKVTSGLHTFVARPKEKFEAKYLGYYINSPAYHNQLLPYMQGTKVTSISKSNIQKTLVAYPDSNEQSKLGTFFSEINSLIISTQKEHDKLIALKKCMLKKMFPKESNLIPEIRFKEFSGNWEEKKLGDIINYNNGIGHEEFVVENGKYELITLKSINTEGQLVSSGRFIDKEFETLKQNTLIMMLSEQSKGMLGMTCIIPCSNKYILNQRIASLIPIIQVDVHFLTKAINNKQQYFEQMGAGTKVQNISRGHVENCIILLPSYREQQKIGSYFQNLDNLISQQFTELEKLKNVKKTLLSKMFV